MTLRHVKKYLESIPRLNDYQPFVINGFDSSLSRKIGGCRIVYDDGIITSSLKLTIPERVRILEELQKPEDMKVSEYLLETGKFKRNDVRLTEYSYIETEDGVPFYVFLSHHGSWDVNESIFEKLPGDVLFIIAEAKKQLEEGRLVHG